MRERISLERRVTVPATFNTPEPTEQYTVVATVWAQVDTPRMGDLYTGDQLYNGVNVQTTPTYRFIVRYRDDISSHDNVIRWNDELYKIYDTGVISPERRSQYLVISARLVGDDTKGANQ
jgi:SPP1 family predicted phage head-tail adaptor